MCIRDRSIAAARWNRRMADPEPITLALLEDEVLFRSVLALSLIHISEPTRPY